MNITQRLLVVVLFFVLNHCAGQEDNRETGQEEMPKERNSEMEERKAMQAAMDSFSLDYLMGKFNPAIEKGFAKIPGEYASRANMYLRKDAYEAFMRMYKAAREDGITLRILSATRNFEAQKGIWEAKWTGQRILSSGENAKKAFPDPKERALKILEYSSMPSTSRHHWGTDIDFNSLNNRYFEAGEGKKVYDWLTTNAARYGFGQPYTPKGAERPYGYNEEKWHWSYLPIAKILTQKAKKELENDMIRGFMGAETARAIDIKTKFILGINPKCK